MWTALAIFLATYLVMALGRLPWFRIDRTGAAIIGASLMIGSGTLSVNDAYAAIDYNTIILLFGMMIVVANLRLSGVFALVTARVLEHLHHPYSLLGAIIGVSGFFSAFFVNDTICIVLTPLVLEIADAARLNPIPYLLAVAMASNVGSVATLTGNPQNMMIGNFSGIAYRDFLAALAPVALLGLALTFVAIALVYRSEFQKRRTVNPEVTTVRVNRALLWKSVTVSLGMIVFFFAGSPVPTVALIAGAVLLITRRVKPQRVYQEIDWQLLVLFIGLFIVVAGMEKAADHLLKSVEELALQRTAWITAVTALLSNVIGNVPAVLVLKPIVNHLADPRRAWLIVAMSSTLAGNLTLVGSFANLIVVQRAERHRVYISFREYLKAGLPLGIATLVLGSLLLR